MPAPSDVPVRRGSLSAAPDSGDGLYIARRQWHAALLNAPAAAVWELADGHRSFADVIAELELWLGQPGADRASQALSAAALLLEMRLLELLPPSSADVVYQAGMADLKAGRFGVGWDGYELRFLRRADSRYLPQPRWRGERLRDHSLFVHAEQGVGDQVLYASCFDELVSSARACTISCDDRLMPLFRRSFPGAAILGELPREDRWQRWSSLDVDYQIPMASVPRYLRREESRFPRRTSYLRADDERILEWRRRLESLGPGLKVGLSWSGGQRAARVVPSSVLEAVAVTPGVRFVCLQYGERAKVLRAILDTTGVEVADWSDSDNFTDLEDLAAKIAALDAVVAAPGTVAHLAGALGRPLHIPFTPEWGCWWITRGEQALWYPSSRVHSIVAGGWKEVARTLEQALARRVSSTSDEGAAE